MPVNSFLYLPLGIPKEVNLSRSTYTENIFELQIKRNLAIEKNNDENTLRHKAI